MNWTYNKDLRCWVTGTPESGAGVHHDSRGYRGPGWYYNVMFEGTMVALGDGPYDLRDEAILDAEEAYTKANQAALSRHKPNVLITMRPTIVCLCGSTRFMEAFQEANLKETLAGKIVLSVGCNTKSDTDLFASYAPEDKVRMKAMLDELHKRKIDLADEVLILNVGGYVGESTRSEIAYAALCQKPVRWLEPVNAS